MADSRGELLFLAGRLDLEATRFDAVLERDRELQHTVVVGSSHLFDVKELRQREALFVLHLIAGLVLRRFDSAKRHRMPRDVDVYVLRIDPRNGHVNAPSLVVRLHLEPVGRCGGRPGWQLAPELVEHPFDVSLEREEIVNGIPTSQTKHTDTPPFRSVSVSFYLVPTIRPH